MRREEKRVWAISIRRREKCNETLNPVGPPLWLNKSRLTPCTSVSRIRNDVYILSNPPSPLPLLPFQPLTIKRTIAHTVDCSLTRPFLCFFFRTARRTIGAGCSLLLIVKRRRALLFDTWPDTSGKQLVQIVLSPHSKNRNQFLGDCWTIELRLT